MKMSLKRNHFGNGDYFEISACSSHLFSIVDYFFRFPCTVRIYWHLNCEWAMEYETGGDCNINRFPNQSITFN